MLWSTDTYSTESEIALPDNANDYDYLEVFTYYNTAKGRTFTTKMVKNTDGYCQSVGGSNGKLVLYSTRNFTWDSTNNKLKCSQAYYQINNYDPVNDSLFLPFMIIGHKLV